MPLWILDSLLTLAFACLIKILNFRNSRFWPKNLFLLLIGKNSTIHPPVIAKKIESFFFKQSKKKVILALSSKYFPNPYTSHLYKTTPPSYLMWTRVNVLSGLSASTLEFYILFLAKQPVSVYIHFLAQISIAFIHHLEKIQNPYYYSPLLPLYLISYHAFLAPVILIPSCSLNILKIFLFIV